MPIEGYHLAFNGTKGRIEVRMYEKQAFDAPDDQDEILVLRHRPLGRAHRRPPRPRRPLRRRPAAAQEPLRPRQRRPVGQRAGARAGALSVLTGVAATRSAETGLPVDILPLLEAG